MYRYNKDEYSRSPFLPRSYGYIIEVAFGERENCIYS